MSDNTEEILGKIEQAHMRGEHTLGMFAGCSICLQTSDGRSMGVSGATDAPSMLEELARNAAVQAEEYRNVIELPRQIATAPSAGSLGDIALQDAQQALDDLETLGRAGIVVPNAEQAVAHALVGAVRALVGIEETLQSLLTIIGNASEKYVDRPEPAALDDDLPPAA